MTIDLDSENTAADGVQAWLARAVAADAAGDVAGAERAFLRVLLLAPDHGDAHFGLGVTLFRQSRFRDAAGALRSAIACGVADAVVHLLLGQALYQIGSFAESAEAFEQVRRAGELQGEPLRRFARARTYAAMIDGDIAAALAAYPALACDDAEPIDTIIRDGFGLLSAYGHRDAAVALGERLLAADPDDVVQRHLNDAVARRAIDSVPAAYVEAHFDAFADGFDDKLVGVLRYGVPKQLADLVQRHRAAFTRMVDVGCGTGLAGAHLQALGNTLTGVDLSKRMLVHAERRGCYTELVHGDAADYLSARPGGFDLVFIADALIYFGKLDDVIAIVAQSLEHDGIFACSTERATADFEILPSGRFAHSDDYLMRLAAPHFELLARETTDIRLEANVPAQGTLFVWRRK